MLVKPAPKRQIFLPGGIYPVCSTALAVADTGDGIPDLIAAQDNEVWAKLFCVPSWRRCAQDL